jgi:cell division protein ZipA
MDADTLRLILIVFGAFLVLGIYLWEKRKRDSARSAEETRLEPTMSAIDDSASHNTADHHEVSFAQAPAEMGEASSEDPKAADLPAMRAEKRKKPARSEPTPKPNDPPAGNEAIPSLILQINIACSGKRFQGEDILEAVKTVNLSTGSMNIFHRRVGDEDQGAVLFSMASMVEPGTFPLDAMEAFNTPGLTLFAQLPGADDSLSIFNDLIDTAERVAEALGGELQDETHSRMTRQTIEHLRSQVVEHRRRVQLAKSRAK